MLTSTEKGCHLFQLRLFHFLPSENRTVSAVGVGTTDVCAIGGSSAGIESYHSVGVQGEKHSFGTKLILPKEEASFARLGQDTHIGGAPRAYYGQESRTVHCLKNYTTLSSIVNPELAGTTVVFPRALTTHVEHTLLVDKGIGTVIEIAKADDLAYG